MQRAAAGCPSTSRISIVDDLIRRPSGSVDSSLRSSSSNPWLACRSTQADDVAGPA